MFQRSCSNFFLRSAACLSAATATAAAACAFHVCHVSCFEKRNFLVLKKETPERGLCVSQFGVVLEFGAWGFGLRVWGLAVKGLIGALLQLRRVPYTLRPTPYVLHPTPYIPHPNTWTLYLKPYTLHPTPHTPHPTPHTLAEV
jgi:hypothetical protein